MKIRELVPPFALVSTTYHGLHEIGNLEHM